MSDLLAHIKEALDACEGMWMLPDDADDLAELCQAAVRRLFEGVEWARTPILVEYEAGDDPEP